MKIKNDMVVVLDYTLVVDGEVADKSAEGQPLKFIFGLGYLLPKFEENIEGKEVGDTFEFTLEAKDGYGEVVPEYIIDLPKSTFEVDGVLREDLLFVGNVISLTNAMNQRIPGKVVEIGEESVKMDLNHPMAGKTLNFSGKIVSLREATEEELTNGLWGERAECNCTSDDCSSCNCSGCH